MKERMPEPPYFPYVLSRELMNFLLLKPSWDSLLFLAVENSPDTVSRRFFQWCRDPEQGEVTEQPWVVV